MRKITLFILIGLFVMSFHGGTAIAKPTPQVIAMTVTEDGYEPSSIDVKEGTDLILKITRKTDETCATEIVITAKKINTKLPLNKEVTVRVGSVQKGDLNFSCRMNMFKGVIHVK